MAFLSRNKYSEKEIILSLLLNSVIMVPNSKGSDRLLACMIDVIMDAYVIVYACVTVCMYDCVYMCDYVHVCTQVNDS